MDTKSVSNAGSDERDSKNIITGHTLAALKRTKHESQRIWLSAVFSQPNETNKVASQTHARARTAHTRPHLATADGAPAQN